MISLNNNSLANMAARRLGGHYAAMGASVKRLSSGLRVNAAADDAASLAIRELMRADISAMLQGARNVNDAISLLQTADGALGIIDEKLIRMKELAEQAATGTYNSTQRLLIHSEFQAMAAEIDRIAAATDFNGVKLLDGSLSGTHDGAGLEAKGALKIHFGAGNDSAEDYYYVKIGDCGTKGLGLRDGALVAGARPGVERRYEDIIDYPPYSDLNDFNGVTNYAHGRDPYDVTALAEGVWHCGMYNGSGSQNSMLLIKKGVKNFVLNQIGTSPGLKADNDIQLFTRDGKHLAGRAPIPDYQKFGALANQPTDLASNCAYMGFTIDQYDATFLNPGARDQDGGATMNFTSYNGMTIGYSGDGPENYDGIARYEILAIDEATEDLVVWLPGIAGAAYKYYIGNGAGWNDVGDFPMPEEGDGALLEITTQEKAQEALERIDEAIMRKDRVRANLGALQNRLENTAANIGIQSENLQAAESRISDADIAIEMTDFIRAQILAQTSLAMLSQANSLPGMIAKLVGA